MTSKGMDKKNKSISNGVAKGKIFFIIENEIKKENGIQQIL